MITDAEIKWEMKTQSELLLRAERVKAIAERLPKTEVWRCFTKGEEVVEVLVLVDDDDDYVGCHSIFFPKETLNGVEANIWYDAITGVYYWSVREWGSERVLGKEWSFDDAFDQLPTLISGPDLIS
ncbi:MAG: hypothetical protein DRR19_18940 [Candidatus Parabeggiatoa sp. nov. 1]|nr:MAG: hypothetical protein DRR19_18940 [Gammaproteobacteria bacterium]